jgi:hypothetical protein
MKANAFILMAVILGLAMVARGEDITTLDGKTYSDVQDVALKQNGLFFVYGSGTDMHGLTVPYDNLPAEIKEKYHYDPFEMGLAYARYNGEIALSKNMAFTLGQLELAKKKAKAEKKLIGFIMVWDQFYVPARPLEQGSDSGLAHFYDVFHNGLVLVFVRHESELGDVPDAVKQGFNGPEEGGYAPNMAVVTADCSKYVCEIPYGGDKSNGGVREQIFREKIAVIKKFEKEQGVN